MTAKRPTQADLARELGLTRGRVTQLVARGMPTFSADAAAAWRTQHVAARAGSTSKAATPQTTEPAQGEGVPVRYDASRARREAAEAELSELRLATERGTLIQIAAIETVWAGAMAAARERLLQLPARMGQLLAAESDAFKIEQLLDAEVHEALHHLAGGSMKPPPTIEGAGA